MGNFDSERDSSLKVELTLREDSSLRVEGAFDSEGTVPSKLMGQSTLREDSSLRVEGQTSLIDITDHHEGHTPPPHRFKWPLVE